MVYYIEWDNPLFVKPQKEELKSFIKGKINDNDPSFGDIEQAGESSRKAADAIALIIEKLMDKGVFVSEDVVSIFSKIL